MPSTPVVIVADTRKDRLASIEIELTAADYRIVRCDSAKMTLDQFYAQPPHCVILRHGMTAPNGQSLLDSLKSDNVFGYVPVVLLVTAEELDAGIDWTAVPADDYVTEPFRAEELTSRIEICRARSMRDVNANPLTGLPGNLTIAREAERRLRCNEPFAFAYLDIDGFKAFNDKYGFARGDEVIRMTGRLLVSIIRAIDRSSTYIGHIGGDDFVFMTPPEVITEACERVLSAFDRISGDFYDESDRAQGHIQSIDRQGNTREFPLMTCSIGAVETLTRSFPHIAELFGRASEVKAHAKRTAGSHFVVDRRK
ncbi:MAG: hypothetical protein AMXMBFR4_06110 [Candidatus Hydrogenedentota bacterium]